jgi:nucleotide-binding universal stress UspA family protein
MIPPRTILVAVDFSDGSRAALAFAARLAVQCGSALHVLHAEDPLLCAAAQHHGRNLSEETLEELRRFVAETRPSASFNPKLHAEAGHASDVIRDIATREQADIVVVGSRGMSGAERLVFGSTTEYVLRNSGVSVLVVPADWKAPRPDAPDLSGAGPVIAGFDFTTSSALAAEAAGGLAAALRTRVELVHVVAAGRVLQRWQAEIDAAIASQVETAKQALSTLAVAIAATAPVETRLEIGSVPERLAAVVASARGEHPLLVLGRRAGGILGGAPGAIAYRLLMDAHVPVLVYLADGAS